MASSRPDRILRTASGVPSRNRDMHSFASLPGRRLVADEHDIEGLPRSYRLSSVVSTLRLGQREEAVAFLLFPRNIRSLQTWSRLPHHTS